MIDRGRSRRNNLAAKQNGNYYSSLLLEILQFFPRKSLPSWKNKPISLNFRSIKTTSSEQSNSHQDLRVGAKPNFLPWPKTVITAQNTFSKAPFCYALTVRDFCNELSGLKFFSSATRLRIFCATKSRKEALLVFRMSCVSGVRRNKRDLLPSGRILRRPAQNQQKIWCAIQRIWR